MIEIIGGIILTLMLVVSVCVYYASKNIEKERNIIHKLKKIIFSRTRKEYLVIGAVFIASVFTFIISQYVYNANIFWTYKWQVAFGLLLPIAVIDSKEKIIPNKLLIIALLFTLLILTGQIFSDKDYIISIIGNSLIGSLVGGGIFLIASLIARNGIGAGDIKMFFVLGLLLSFRGIFNVLLYSMVVSAVYSIILLISRKKTMKDELPLAPFTLIGIVVSILFGV